MHALKKNRDSWLFEKANEIVGFYTREFYCLDNFSAFKITYKDHKYSTVEEAYQALGFIDTAPEIAKAIIDSGSAHDAQRIAHENAEKRRADWDEMKVSLMEELLRAKLSQHPYVKKKLLETGDLPIVEDSPKDSFWGWGPNRDGKNELGKLWMKLRTELRNAKS